MKPIASEVVAVLGTKSDNRNFGMPRMQGRALVLEEVFELLITDEQTADLQVANRVAAVALLRVLSGGVVTMKEKIYITEKLVGEVVGFNFDHLAEQNVVHLIARADKFLSGEEMGIQAGAICTIHE